MNLQPGGRQTVMISSQQIQTVKKNIENRMLRNLTNVYVHCMTQGVTYDAATFQQSYRIRSNKRTRFTLLASENYVHKLKLLNWPK